MNFSFRDLKENSTKNPKTSLMGRKEKKSVKDVNNLVKFD